jgi:hypothetical protein
MITALFRTPHPHRLELLMNAGKGPLTNGERPFDPQRDLQVYVGGLLTPVISWAWDSGADRYLLYMAEDLGPYADLIQVIHHVIQPPFGFSNNSSIQSVGGLALLSTWTKDPDPTALREVTDYLA